MLIRILHVLILSQLALHCNAYSNVDATNGTVVQAVTTNGTKVDKNLPWKKCHGICMLLAWWVFIVNGILIARYFKSVITKQVGGAKLWFNLHRGTTMLGLLCAVIGLIATLYTHKGTWAGDKPGPPGVHSILGLTALVTGFFNPVLAFFRCNPGTDARPLFNWLHRTLGVAAWCCASAAIFEITKDPFKYDLNVNGRYGTVPRDLMLVYFIALGIVVLALEELYLSFEGKSGVVKLSQIFFRCKKNKLSPSLSTASTVDASACDTPSSNVTKFGNLRLIALLLFNMIGVSIAIAEATFIGLSGSTKT